MKIKNYLTLSFTLLISTINAQQLKEEFNKNKCDSDAMHREKLLTDPVYKKNMDDFEASLLNKPNTATARVGATYIIPVVVHVMYKGEALGVGSNISDDAIKAKIRTINETFRKIPGSIPVGNGVDVGVEFALAIRDPSGNCTNGINRIDMSSYADYMANGIKKKGLVGMTDTTLKGLSYWNSTQYYNIWLVYEIDNNEGGSGVQGYAYFAGAHGQTYDGALVLANGFKNAKGTTETHELGHALNLYHTFEGSSGSTCPAVSNGCGSNTGDCCADTPPHIASASDCLSTGTNSCNGNSSNALFVNNFMDYSADTCQNMLTADQKTRVQAAISGTRASYLAENGNNKLIPTAAPTANFIQSAQIVCVGQTIKMYDNSSCIPNTYLNDDTWSGISFNWNITNGTTTLTSTIQNPSFTFANQGNYTITYTVTNALGTNTKTVVNGIYVKPTAVSACVPSSSNVGNYAFTVNNVNFNTINNSTSTVTNAAHTDYSCTINTAVTVGQTYPISVSIRANNYPEYCEVYIDYNNNGAFDSTEKVLFGTTPITSTSIVTANITIPTTAVQNTLLRMRVIGEANAYPTAGKLACSSVYFVGDVEDYGVLINPVMSNEVFSTENLTYFPNPTTNVLNINYDKTIDEVQVSNVLGQNLIAQKSDTNQVKIDLSYLAPATYFVKITANGKSKVVKIVKN